ncbi:hypothetical protein GCM10010169_03260 [Micromonospora fulviviridis]|nr:hypothetical protein GCM10010169_03260 [Micromonospora fulviviridis]
MPGDWWPWVSGFGPLSGPVRVVDMAPPSGTGYAYVTVTRSVLDRSGHVDPSMDDLSYVRPNLPT